eukprot:scpid49331/ scgid7323/ Membrane-bound O-acyltransferase domain-containing protein 2
MDEELASVSLLTRQVYVAADSINLARDQLLFFACTVFAFVGSALFNLLLPPVRTSTALRHAVLTTFGVLLLFYCYGGTQTCILVGVSVVSQLLMQYAPANYMHVLVFIVSMGCLAGTHIFNMVFHFGEYKVDYTGSLMVITAKISGMAFALHDGVYKKAESLTAEQKQLSLARFPSLLEYYSYLFNFPSALAMPMASFKEYATFVSGASLPADIRSGKKRLFSNYLPAFGKAGYGIILLGLHLVISPMFPILDTAKEDFLGYSFVYRVAYMYVAGLFLRCRYYFAFVFADSTVNAAGFGHCVDKKTGQSSWDGCTNIRPFSVELATSPKTAIDNWNIQTGRWLRYIAYERFPWAPRVATFVLSAIWHGFYGGYLVSMPFSAFLGEAAVRVRRRVRPYFQTSSSRALLYDQITRIGTMVHMNYALTPFMCLEFWPGMLAWRNVYFFGTFTIFGVLLFVPAKKRPAPATATANGVVSDGSNGVVSNGSSGSNGIKPHSQ